MKFAKKSFRLSKRGGERLLITSVFLLSLIALLFNFPVIYNAVALKIHENAPVLPEYPFHLGLDLQGGAHLVYEADISNIAEQEQSAAIEGVRDVIERRVNVMGVSEPIVQTNKVGDTYRVIVELAGVHDVNQAIQMIGETPLLEFKQLAVPMPITPEQELELERENEQIRQEALQILGQLQQGADFAQMAQEYSQDPGSATQGGSLGWFSRGVMVPEFEQAAFNLAKGQMTRELVQTPFGYHIIRKEDERVNDVTGEEEILASHILFFTLNARDVVDMGGDMFGFESTGLGGNHLSKARVEFNPNTGEPYVGLHFNQEGKELFREITQENIGKPVAIYLDGFPISVPTVQNVIMDGEAVITGIGNLQEAKMLAQRLNAGALPIPIELVMQQTVGASLGQESLQKSLRAGLWGLVFVILFMLFIYRLPGFIAILALSIYCMIVLFLFKMIPVTLTLAGIAGFILSIGLAVDANILIFERMKELLRNKAPLSMAVKEGFSKAWPSIRDGNVSTLITCFILATFGTSMIKGFAITLAIGVIVSMFSAIVITRLLLLFISKWSFVKRHNLLGMKERV